MLSLLLLLAQPALPRAIPNPGFERDGGRLAGWEVYLPRGYGTAVITERPFAGRRSAFIGYLARNAADRDGPPASLSTTIDARRYRGRIVRVSAALRLSAAGHATMQVEVDGVQQAADGRDESQGREWGRVAASLRIPPRARTLRISFKISPGNDLEVDDVRLERRP